MSIVASIPSKFWMRLCANRCVAFLGAGFSLPAGFPTWRGMVTNLVDEARTGGAARSKPREFALAEDFLKNGDYALAAVLLVQEELIEKSERSKALGRMFASPRDVPPRMKQRLESLLSAPWAGILTTNYDRLVDDKIGGSTEFRKVENAGPQLGTLLSDPSRFFAKLHGESWKEDGVLTTEDYHRTYLREPYLQIFLPAVMLAHHLVFIGCSLEDEIVRMRVRLCESFNQQVPRAYALMPKNSETERRSFFLDKYAGIECWLYDPNDIDHPDHGGVDAFLDATAACAGNTEGADELALLPIGDRLKKIGRLNRMLLRAVLACGGKIESSVFNEAEALLRRQTKDGWLSGYYSHLDRSQLRSCALQFIAADLLSPSGSDLLVHADLEIELRAFRSEEP